MTATSNDFVYMGLLLFVRFFVALRITPLAGLGPLPTLAGGALALALTLLGLPFQVPVPVPDSGVAGAMALVWEAAAGAIWGIAAAICWSLFRTAGSLVQLSALSPDEDSPWSRFHVVLGTALFFLAGGHRAVFAAMLGSTTMLPPGQVLVGDEILWMVVGLLSGAFTYGVLMVAPVFVASLCALWLIGIAQRLFHSPTGEGAWAVRAVVVQVVVLGVLWKTMDIGVAFLLTQMGTLGG